MSKKKSIQEVKETIEKEGCLLISDQYKDRHSYDLSIVCNCGNQFTTSLSSFTRGNDKCKICSKENAARQRRHTIEYVREVFEKAGCILLSKEYKNSNQKLSYICGKCGEVSKIKFSAFQRGRHQCRNCGIQERASKQKYTQEYVEEYFLSNNCIVLSEYKSTHQKLNYVCECGEESIITFSCFKRGQRCRSCGYKNRKDPRTYTTEYVKQYFLDHACQMLSETYVNLNTKIDYLCECQNKSSITFDNFLNGHRCYQCGINKIKKSQVGLNKNGNFKKHSIEYVKEFFEKRNCLLISEVYVSSKFPLSFQCECGNISEITFNYFQQGHRCEKCKIKSVGEKLIGDWLDDRNISYEPQSIHIGNKRFDFEINNLLIEYQGVQHYVPYAFKSTYKDADIIKLKKYILSDFVKFNWCMKNNIPLLIIPYWDMKQIPIILEDVLIRKIEPVFGNPHNKINKYYDLRQQMRQELGIKEPEVLYGLFNM